MEAVAFFLEGPESGGGSFQPGVNEAAGLGATAATGGPLSVVAVSAPGPIGVIGVIICGGGGA